jgi:predicted ArsR family transcriptional regulator
MALQQPKEDLMRTLKHDTWRVLVHLFKAEERGDRDVEAMAKRLEMERNVIRYHLDQLKEAGLADIESGKYIHGPIYWGVTAEGRRYVVEGNLI